MKKIINYIFHETSPITHIVGEDRATMMLNTITDFGVFLFFASISVMCFVFSSTITPKEAYHERRISTFLLGASMFFCALSRALNVIAVWHNYYFLNGIFKAFCVLFALSVTAYSPYVIRAIKSTRELEKLKVSLEETSKKVEELKDISNKVLKKENENE